MTYSSAVLTDAPIAYYRLGEVSGTTMADSSGNGRDGAYSLTDGSLLGQPGLLTGDADTSVKFISNNDIATVDVSTHTAFKSTLVSCSARVKFAGAFGSQTIAGRYAGSLSDGAWVFRRDSGLLTCYIFIGGSYRVAQTATALADNVEYSVGFSWDGATIRLFVDGSAAGSATGAAATMNTGTSDFYIGRRGVTATEGMFGWVDEVAVYDYRLPDARFATYHSEALSPTTGGASGTLSAVLPTLSASLSGGVTYSGTIAATLPPLGANLSGTSLPPGIAGTLSAALPPLGGSLAGAYSDTATLAAILPPLSADLTGTAVEPPVTGTLSATLPGLSASLAGAVFEPGVGGYLAAILPVLSASMSGDVLGRAGLGLVLDSSAVLTVDPVLEPEPTVPAGTPPTALHIIAPTVPVPTLVAGRPQ